VTRVNRTDATVTPLHAVRYSGPDGRAIVRLVPAQLTTAEDLTLASVGVTRATGVSDRAVGTTTVRAVGFPAWPIITDPDNARHALNLVGDLERARRKVNNHPADVREEFEKLTSDLAETAPHFVPTLLEELSRIFAYAGNIPFARQYFGRAREIERSHNVPVDPERHQAMFTEFAAAGIVGAKEMSAECSAALERFDEPSDALAHVLAVMAALTEAGNGPYAGMPKDVRKVAKAAGLKPAAADEKLLDAVLTGRGFPHATDGFLKALKTSLPRYLAGHPEAAEHFARHRPRGIPIEGFLTVLDNCGQLDRMRSRAGYAQWLFDMVVNAPTQFSSLVPTFYREVRSVSADIPGLDASRLSFWMLHPALVDALLGAGLTVPPTDSRGRRPFVRMDRWYREPYGDLEHVAADPVLAPTALGMRNNIGELGSHLDDLLAHGGTRSLLADRLAGLAAARRDLTGAIPTLAASVKGVLEHLADPRTAELAPEAVAGLFAFDPAEELAAAVRSGLFAEYTWPDFERAYFRARNHAGSEKVQVAASFPDVSLIGGDHIEVLGPDGPAWSGDGPLTGTRVRAVYTVGESGVVLYTVTGTDQHYAWWFGEPAAVPTERIATNRLGEGVRIGDGRLLGGGVLHVGDDISDAHRSDYTVIDLPGTDTVAALEVWGQTVTFFDERTGESRGSGTLSDLPDAAETLGIGTAVPDTLPLQWRMSAVVSLPSGTGHTMAGSTDGRQVTLTYAASPFDGPQCVLTPLGRVERRPDCAPFPAPFPVPSAVGRDTLGLLELPAGGLLARVGKDAASPVTGAQLSRSVTADGHPHPLHELPASLWFAVTPRDEDVSRRMRSYTPAQAQEVLQLAPDHSGMRALLATQLGAEAGGDAGDILASVVECAAEVTDVAAAFSGVRGRLSAVPEETEEPPGTTLTGSGSRAFSPDDPVGNPDDLVRQATRLGTWLSAGADGFRPADTPGHWSSLHRAACYLGREKLLIARLAAAYAADGRADPVNAAEFAAQLVRAGVLANGWDAVTVAAPQDVGVRERLFASGAGWFDLGAPVHLMRYSWYRGLPDAGFPTHLLVRRADRAKLTVELLGESAAPGDSMEATDLLAALDRVKEQASTRRCVDADQATLLAEQTGLPGPTARAVLGGVNSTPGGSPDLRFKSTDLWDRYGLTRAEVDLAQSQVIALDRRHGGGFLDRLTMGLVEGDSPAGGVAARWRSLVDAGNPRLSDREWLTVSGIGGGHRDSPLDILTQVLLQGCREPEASGPLLAGLLAVIAEVPMDDPRRPAFAEQLQWAKDAAMEFIGDPAHAGVIGTMDIGCPVDDPSFTEEITPDNQVVRVLTEGLLDELIADLDVVYPDSPGAVHDPLNSAADLVTEVTSALSVGEDAARYFLQVLALAEPTDANVRAWNGWRKKDIDAAGGELVTAGVVVRAKRAKAARSVFLPGGWLEGRSGVHAARPMEVWKAPMYLLWADTKVRPVIPGLPPHMPAAALFRRAWERYSDGDVPGYGNLTTTRYRAGSRSRR
jgi:hypothetical protein